MLSAPIERWSCFHESNYVSERFHIFEIFVVVVFLFWVNVQLQFAIFYFIFHFFQLNCSFYGIIVDVFASVRLCQWQKKDLKLICNFHRAKNSCGLWIQSTFDFMSTHRSKRDFGEQLNCVWNVKFIRVNRCRLKLCLLSFCCIFSLILCEFQLRVKIVEKKYCRRRVKSVETNYLREEFSSMISVLLSDHISN